MKRILLIGGAGYVGSVLARELLERGYAVRIFDRFLFGRQGLTGIEDRVEVCSGDMRALPAGVLTDIDTVINVGGLSNDPCAEYNPAANLEMNTTAAIVIAQACLAAGVPRYLYASSCSIYDHGTTNEQLDTVLDEDSPVAPRAAYSSSKHQAELGILPLAGPHFCPVALRMGTVFGFSRRMRYDLVVNTFVRDTLLHGEIRLHCGGEMWRPLVEVRDAARAYIMLIETPADRIAGQVFNVALRNFRISELALRVRQSLGSIGINAEIRPDYGYRGVRSYRVSCSRIQAVVGWSARIEVEESVCHMVDAIRQAGYTDFLHPRYCNIEWLEMIDSVAQQFACDPALPSREG